jgi:predicted GNAT family acetyltransferase
MTEIDEKVADNREQTRYEVHQGDELVAIADYVRQPGLVSFTHTETFDGHKGQGIAGRMIDRALRDAREEQLEVIPFCWFVASYIGDHDEFLPLVPAERRAEFGLSND